MNEGRQFAFDPVDAAFELVPMAARRALDHLGAKISLDAWQSLGIDDRRAVWSIGSQPDVDVLEVQRIVERADPLPRSIDPILDPSSERVPSELTRLLGDERPLPTAVWSSLEPLERWVLVKLSDCQKLDRLMLAYDELVGEGQLLSHLNARGEARMVGTTEKGITTRYALATAVIEMSEEAHRCLLKGNAPKGDVLGTARVAGIMAAKRTAELIPLCHPVRLTRIDLVLDVSATAPSVEVRAAVTAVDRTGVEMEALVAASIAALTIYDMLKAVDRNMVVRETRLMRKSGGRSGDFER
jgi:cyclic pyranopterin phosphate synthase